MEEVLCKHCSGKIHRRGSQLALYKNSFCSRECLAAFNKKGELRNCSFCGKELYATKARLRRSKTGRVFCSRSCATSFRNTLRAGVVHPNYRNGAHGSKQKALKRAKSECESCGYSRVPEILEIHHLDRNRDNNTLENLIILCPNCHQEAHFEGKDGRYKLNSW